MSTENTRQFRKRRSSILKWPEPDPSDQAEFENKATNDTARYSKRRSKRVSFAGQKQVIEIATVSEINKNWKDSISSEEGLSRLSDIGNLGNLSTVLPSKTSTSGEKASTVKHEEKSSGLIQAVTSLPGFSFFDNSKLGYDGNNEDVLENKENVAVETEILCAKDFLRQYSSVKTSKSNMIIYPDSDPPPYHEVVKNIPQTQATISKPDRLLEQHSGVSSPCQDVDAVKDQGIPNSLPMKESVSKVEQPQSYFEQLGDNHGNDDMEFTSMVTRPLKSSVLEVLSNDENDSVFADEDDNMTKEQLNRVSDHALSVLNHTCNNEMDMDFTCVINKSQVATDVSMNLSPQKVDDAVSPSETEDVEHNAVENAELHKVEPSTSPGLDRTCSEYVDMDFTCAIQRNSATALPDKFNNKPPATAHLTDSNDLEFTCVTTEKNQSTSDVIGTEGETAQLKDEELHSSNADISEKDVENMDFTCMTGKVGRDEKDFVKFHEMSDVKENPIDLQQENNNEAPCSETDENDGENMDFTCMTEKVSMEEKDIANLKVMSNVELSSKDLGQKNKNEATNSNTVEYSVGGSKVCQAVNSNEKSSSLLESAEVENENPLSDEKLEGSESIGTTVMESGIDAMSEQPSTTQADIQNYEKCTGSGASSVSICHSRSDNRSLNAMEVESDVNITVAEEKNTVTEILQSCDPEQYRDEAVNGLLSDLTGRTTYMDDESVQRNSSFGHSNETKTEQESVVEKMSIFEECFAQIMDGNHDVENAKNEKITLEDVLEAAEISGPQDAWSRDSVACSSFDAQLPTTLGKKFEAAHWTPQENEILDLYLKKVEEQMAWAESANKVSREELANSNSPLFKLTRSEFEKDGELQLKLKQLAANCTALGNISWKRNKEKFYKGVCAALEDFVTGDLEETCGIFRHTKTHFEMAQKELTEEIEVPNPMDISEIERPVLEQENKIKDLDHQLENLDLEIARCKAKLETGENLQKELERSWDEIDSLRKKKMESDKTVNLLQQQIYEMKKSEWKFEVEEKNILKLYFLNSTVILRVTFHEALQPWCWENRVKSYALDCHLPKEVQIFESDRNLHEMLHQWWRNTLPVSVLTEQYPDLLALKSLLKLLYKLNEESMNLLKTCKWISMRHVCCVSAFPEEWKIAVSFISPRLCTDGFEISFSFERTNSLPDALATGCNPSSYNFIPGKRQWQGLQLDHATTLISGICKDKISIRAVVDCILTYIDYPNKMFDKA